MFTKMNEDEGFLQRLITLVKEHPELYDKNETNYYNVAAKQNIWVEIAKHCDKSDNKCKHRWRLMRERFTKELKRLQKPLGKRQNYREPWKYFDQMMFLRESITHRSKGYQLEETDIPVKNEFIRVSELYDDEESVTFLEDTQTQSESNDVSKSTDSMLQGLIDVSNTCKKQAIESKEFSSLIAINMLMQDLPEYMKDEFLKEMYVKVMELRAKARAAGELENKTET